MLNPCILVTLFGLSAATILDSFKDHGIVHEVYGEGRLVEEKEKCTTYKMELFDYINSLHTNEMTEMGKEMLKRRIYSSFEAVCKSFEVPIEQETSVKFGKINRPTLRFMDRFEIEWNAQKFERDLQSLFLENKIGNPFLNTIGNDSLLLAGSVSPQDFSQRTTIFPNKCNVDEMIIHAQLCFNISNNPQSGSVYALAHAGEFLADDAVFAYYEIPEFVLITAESVFPINLSQCKVVFGTYIYCFGTPSSDCDLKTLAGCPIYGRKAGDGFTFSRTFGTSGKIFATTNIEVDIFNNGTMTPVPAQIFTTHLHHDGNGVVTSVDITPVKQNTSIFPEIEDSTIAVLNGEESTHLYEAQQRGKPYLSHKRYDQTAWEAVRSFFGKYI
ncbi:hypothetical protein WR25_11053 isoform A [Diploscapter pachys]|uniref:Uncharacterized protein n=1 Tax=Diploscapter pachys TaxID=2018661 RepID=A0A2A2LTH9_9BILA|nr:hypothetical protein WR25_11053 isoform A [Diploscapter pachys]